MSILYEPIPAPDAAALVRFAEGRGLSGNIARLWLTDQLMRAENAYSLACEQRAGASGSLLALAEEDFAGLYQRFRQTEPAFADYQPLAVRETPENEALRALCAALEEAPDAAGFQRVLTDWYGTHGAGALGVARAFRAAEENAAPRLVPLTGLAPVCFDDLVGYSLQKEALRTNVEAFLAGLPANDMLLYGDAGTGKSTSVKALLTAYGDQGLRVVEIMKPQFHVLGELIDLLGTRPYHFLIFMDDLSFEENEIEYKHLKAVIEGGIAPRPANVLLCATSNRRHIVRETWGDRADMEHNEDVHRSDTMEEKLSLAERFGCQINYSTPDRKLYHEIVDALARDAGIEMEREVLYRQADAWEIRHGGVSGRCARQFVHHLLALQKQ